MRAKIKIDDAAFTRLQFSLQRLGKTAPAHAARTLRRAALRIVEKAKLYAPEDTSALVDSIRLEEVPGRRITFRVVMGGGQMTEWGVPLDLYATLVHEHYDSIRTSGKYVGQGTRDKEASGIAVGEFFLTRAAEEEEGALARAAAEAVKEAIDLENL